MRVIQVTPRYLPNVGGVEVVVQRISETLVKHHIDVTVYSIDANYQVPRQQKINHVLVKRFSSLLGDPFFLPEPKFMIDLRREKADLIHVHNAHTLPPLLVALMKHRTQKMLLQPHYHRFGQSVLRHSLFGLYKRALKNIVFPTADLVIANSAYENRALHEDFPEINTMLVPEGIDTDEVRAIKHAPVKPYRILYVGALKRYKNVDKILEGFAHFSRTTGDGSKLVIVGNGPEYEFLVALSHSLGLDSLVEWKHGLSRKQLLDEYAKASVFILLSQLESFSRVVYDALLIRVPAVVLNFGAMEDLVRTGVATGVNSFDPKEIAAGLQSALGRNVPIPPNYGKAFLGWQEYSKCIMNVYYELVKESTIL